jgi:hypothetical protein
MKKLLLSFVLLVFVNIASSQVITDSTAYLDINQIKALISSGGMNFCKLPDYTAAYEYPAGSGKKTIFSSTLWIGGKSNNMLYLAGERYRQYGRDYNPGPVMDTTFYIAELANWNKVWKINKSDIDYHRAHWSDVGYTIPASLQTWPAHGTTAHGMNYFQAPFEDVDSNFFYNPSLGDYPKIRGDQAIYFIFNDSVRGHFDSGGKRMGVEVHGMAYAYNTVPQYDKAVFVNYLFYNRSNRTYDSLYIGNFTDFDIGFSNDDFVGCDSSLNTFYGYNALQTDTVYGNNPPVQTITMLNLPMTSFVYFNNLMPGWNAQMTDPSTAADYYSYMKGFWKDGKHFIYGKNGYPTDTTDTILCNYIFPGYPNDSLQWNEVNAGNSPSDRRGLGVSGPYTLAPGAYLSFDLAFITVDSAFVRGQGFPNVDNMLLTVSGFQQYFDSVHPDNGHDIALGVNDYKSKSEELLKFNVFPNPAKDILTITSDIFNSNLQVNLMDLQGRIIATTKFKGKQAKLNVSAYNNGIYLLRIFSAKTSQVVKFVKM